VVTVSDLDDELFAVAGAPVEERERDFMRIFARVEKRPSG